MLKVLPGPSHVARTHCRVAEPKPTWYQARGTWEHVTACEKQEEDQGCWAWHTVPAQEGQPRGVQPRTLGLSLGLQVGCVNREEDAQAGVWSDARRGMEAARQAGAISPGPVYDGLACPPAQERACNERITRPDCFAVIEGDFIEGKCCIPLDSCRGESCGLLVGGARRLCSGRACLCPRLGADFLPRYCGPSMWVTLGRGRDPRKSQKTTVAS